MRLFFAILALALVSCDRPRPIPEPFDAPARWSMRSIAPAPCGPCDGWWTIDHRSRMCADAAVLFDAKISCMRTGCAVASCATWLAAFDACEANKMSDPGCWVEDDPACDVCLTTPVAAGGCLEEANACGANASGAITCAVWLAGGDPQWLSGAAVGPAIAVEDCACSACAVPCVGSCNAYGALDTSGLSGTCAACLAASCSTALLSCQSNAPVM